MRIITLEGENYVFTLPNKLLGERLAEHLQNKMPDRNNSQQVHLLQKVVGRESGTILDVLTSYPLTRQEGEACDITITYQEKDGKLGKNKIHQKRMSKRCFALFCLIPLTKDGKVDRSMRMANPDGTEVSFGELVIAGSPLEKNLLHWGEKGTAITLRDCEAPENKLDWVWIDGKLVSCSLCLMTSAAHLMEEGLFATAAPLGEKMTAQQLDDWLSVFDEYDFE